MQEKEFAPRDPAKKSFVFYYDWRSRFDALTDTESKSLLIAMLDYAEYGKTLSGGWLFEWEVVGMGEKF